MQGFLKLLIKLGELRFGAIDTAQGRVENTHLAGGVPEWPKGTDCKSVGTAFGGSNPPPSTIIFFDQGEMNFRPGFEKENRVAWLSEPGLQVEASCSTRLESTPYLYREPV